MCYSWSHLIVSDELFHPSSALTLDLSHFLPHSIFQSAILHVGEKKRIDRTEEGEKETEDGVADLSCVHHVQNESEVIITK